MKLSDHEINSALRERLQMPTGRHLYAILGTYGSLERYERVSFSQALGVGRQAAQVADQPEPGSARPHPRRGPEGTRPERGEAAPERPAAARRGVRPPARRGVGGRTLRRPQAGRTGLRLRHGVELPADSGRQQEAHPPAAAGGADRRPHHPLPRGVPGVPPHAARPASCPTTTCGSWPYEQDRLPAEVAGPTLHGADGHHRRLRRRAPHLGGRRLPGGEEGPASPNSRRSRSSWSIRSARSSTTSSGNSPPRTTRPTRPTPSARGGGSRPSSARASRTCSRSSAPLALGDKDAWEIVREKEEKAGKGKRETIHQFYENGIAKKSGGKSKGIFVAVKTLVGQGGGTVRRQRHRAGP